MLNIDSISQNRNPGFGYLPSKPEQIFYRVPFLFHQKASDRVHDAWESVVPVIDILKNETRLEIIADEDTASCICDDSSRVEISKTFSDLWIKIEAATLPLPSPLKKIDTFIKKLKKPAFKYVRDKSRTLSFPLVCGSWGNTVKEPASRNQGRTALNGDTASL
jgi:hypothetical protein